jgi:hypothetical protein
VYLKESEERAGRGGPVRILAVDVFGREAGRLRQRHRVEGLAGPRRAAGDLGARVIHMYRDDARTALLPDVTVLDHARTGQHPCGADTGMTGVRQLSGGSEDMHPVIGVRGGRGQGEHRLGQVELAGDGLHRRIGERVTPVHGPVLV